MDCTSKLIQHVFGPKFICARTKARMIVLNVLTPFALSELQSNIQTTNIISVLTDASKYKDTRIIPVLVRYLEPSKGVQVKLLEHKSLPEDRMENVSEFLNELSEQCKRKT
jgi:hypothetical protein